MNEEVREIKRKRVVISILRWIFRNIHKNYMYSKLQTEFNNIDGIQLSIKVQYYIFIYMYHIDIMAIFILLD